MSFLNADTVLLAQLFYAEQMYFSAKHTKKLGEHVPIVLSGR